MPTTGAHGLPTKQPPPDLRTATSVATKKMGTMIAIVQIHVASKSTTKVVETVGMISLVTLRVRVPAAHLCLGDTMTTRVAGIMMTLVRATVTPAADDQAHIQPPTGRVHPCIFVKKAEPLEDIARSCRKTRPPQALVPALHRKKRACPWPVIASFQLIQFTVRYMPVTPFSKTLHPSLSWMKRS